VLRLWRDVLRVVISPRQLTLVRTTPWRARVIEAHVIDVPQTAAGNGDADSEGRAALSMLQELAHEAAWQGTTVRIVLSNRLARFMVAPPANAALGKIDSAAVASHYFKTAYGDIAANWACRLDAAGGRIAMAVDRTLLDALLQCFPLPHYRIQSVQPALAVAFNGWRRTFGPAPQWFAMREAGHTCLCLLQSGEWQQVRGIDADDDLPAEVLRSIAREQALTGMEQPPATLSMLVLDGKPFELPEGSGIRLRRLTMPKARMANPSAGVALALAA
jgi:hypothetical protein